MGKKARLGLYLEDDEVKNLVKMAAARRGMSVTAYCAEAIEERLRRDGEIDTPTGREALLSRMDRLKDEIGAVGVTTAELVKEGRRR